MTNRVPRPRRSRRAPRLRLSPELAYATYVEVAGQWGVAIRTVQRWIQADLDAGYRVRKMLHRRNACRRWTLVRVADLVAVLARHRPATGFGLVKRNLVSAPRGRR